MKTAEPEIKIFRRMLFMALGTADKLFFEKLYFLSCALHDALEEAGIRGNGRTNARVNIAAEDVGRHIFERYEQYKDGTAECEHERLLKEVERLTKIIKESEDDV